MKAKIVVPILLVIIAVAALMVFRKPKEEGIVLTIITRHDTAIQLIFEEAFLQTDLAKQYNIVDLKFIGTPPQYWRTVIGRGGIDIAWGGGPTLFNENIDLLQPLTGELVMKEVNAIPDTIAGSSMKRFDDQGRVVWVASAISSFGFIVNHNFIDKYGLDKPQTWEDLASPDFLRDFPTIAMAKPFTSTSHTRIYEIILQAFGWEDGWRLISRMAANGRLYGGSVEAWSAVETGEVGVSIAIDFYGYTSQVKDPNLEYVLPQGETIINGDPIALVNGTKHAEAAEAFIAYVLSVEGQANWLNPRLNRMPVRGEVFRTEAGKKRPDLYRLYNLTITNIGIEFSDDLALSYEATMRAYFEAVISDLHSELVNVWRSIVQAYRDGKINEEQFNMLTDMLGTPVSWTEDGKTVTMTIEYAQSINEKIRMDPEFQAQEMVKWKDAAREQYQRVYEELQSLISGG